MTNEDWKRALELVQEIGGSTDRIERDLSMLKCSLSAVETHLGQHQLQLAAMNARMDHVDERLGRIERRLDLVSA